MHPPTKSATIATQQSAIINFFIAVFLSFAVGFVIGNTSTS
jgi:hypothetical protein